MLVYFLSLPLKCKHPKVGDYLQPQVISRSPKPCTVILYSPKPYAIAKYTVGTRPVLGSECQMMSASVNE